MAKAKTAEPEEAEPPKRPKMAFRCKHCGRTVEALAAGELAFPRRCPSCGHGVEFKVNEDGTGFQVIEHPENWTVLADLSAAELKKDFAIHGLTADDIEEHTVKPPTEVPAGTHTHLTATETIGSKDKAK